MQQPAVVLPVAEGTGEVRLYRCQLPPWPHDERDAVLTAVVASSGSSSGAGGSGAGGGSTGASAWGGMWGTLGQPDETSLVATPAAESFDVAADVVADGGGVAAEQQPSPAAPAGGQPAAASPVVHAWSAAGDLQQGSSLQAVQQIAAAYLAALQLQQSLDSMLAAGQAAAAVQCLQQSLAALSGPPAGSSDGSSSSSRAACGSLALGTRHVLRMRLLADLHRAAIAAEQWEAALAAAYELLPLYRQTYPPVSRAAHFGRA